jgi:hypothetical protein
MDSDQAIMVAAEPLKYLFGQKFIHGDGSVTGSIVVMQHPSVRNLWPKYLVRILYVRPLPVQ